MIVNDELDTAQRDDSPGPLRFLAAVVAAGPPGIGTALIVLVATDGSTAITRSPAVAATALAVGAFLILGSAAIYCWKPRNFVDFAKSFAGYVDHPDAAPTRDEDD